MRISVDREALPIEQSEQHERRAGELGHYTAGEADYLPPGHRFEVVEDCEHIEFSPTKELHEAMAVVARNQIAG